MEINIVVQPDLNHLRARIVDAKIEVGDVCIHLGYFAGLGRKQLAQKFIAAAEALLEGLED